MIPLEYMPPLMFGGLVVFMLIGFPVAFSLSAVGLAFGFLAIEWGYFPVQFLQAVPSRVFGSVLSNDCLLYTSPSPRDQRGSRMPSSA